MRLWSDVIARAAPGERPYEQIRATVVQRWIAWIDGRLVAPENPAADGRATAILAIVKGISLLEFAALVTTADARPCFVVQGSERGLCQQGRLAGVAPNAVCYRSPSYVRSEVSRISIFKKVLSETGSGRAKPQVAASAFDGAIILIMRSFQEGFARSFSISANLLKQLTLPRTCLRF